MPDNSLVKVRNLKKYFPVEGGIIPHKINDIQAVDDVSFDIKHQETLALVGESGCGKTTTARCIALLEKATAGKIFYDGKNILDMRSRDLNEYHKNVGMIFQDPFKSLNPRMPIADIIGEPLSIHGGASGRKKELKAAALLQEVDMAPHHIYRYPHEFSGGQKQRIAVARALALRPKLVLADEPVSSVDVSIRAAILHLMESLQKKHKLSYLFITHDLSVVKYIADRVLVMYLGKIVEKSDKKGIFTEPLHPYTKALISAVPIPDPTVKMNPIILRGGVPSPIDPPQGCRFHPRCPEAMDICENEEPKLKKVGDERYVACHLFD
ncbi:MAG: ATP-binding cassette domain-containing protein [Candidatus Korarchaeota archaeon]|nr:ATP-binding cassette domain-containing protein [Candidatus Korarchaeota archaeon]NIU83659.1 ATP-binding cassette domain-containing protein [Candidatus Thorarchaeota archaeon]NIW15534.1 ATP-binding cassette domain-containing protein [Candidatus Thorarchaeota archaeon]NIW53480.1 ATP-binding cassette domain-containing protein [Candidatus Korarchaeota archaeon]